MGGFALGARQAKAAGGQFVAGHHRGQVQLAGHAERHAQRFADRLVKKDFPRVLEAFARNLPAKRPGIIGANIGANKDAADRVAALAEEVVSGTFSGTRAVGILFDKDAESTKTVLQQPALFNYSRSERPIMLAE